MSSGGQLWVEGCLSPVLVLPRATPDPSATNPSPRIGQSETDCRTKPEPHWHAGQALKFATVPLAKMEHERGFLCDAPSLRSYGCTQLLPLKGNLPTRHLHQSSRGGTSGLETGRCQV